MEYQRQTGCYRQLEITKKFVPFAAMNAAPRTSQMRLTVLTAVNASRKNQPTTAQKLLVNHAELNVDNALFCKQCGAGRVKGK